jgi:MFS family permease
MLQDRGMSAGSAALAQSTLGAALVASRVLIGFVMDRLFAPFVAIACFLLTTIGLAGLAGGAVGPLAFIAVIFIGVSMGAEIDMLAFLTGRYFGVENFGQVYGILFASFVLGTSTGPVVFGMAFDALGSYVWILLVSIGLMLLSAGFTARLPRYSR